MTDAQIKYMVDRFLGWKLPETFNPDAGISFKKFFNEHMPWGPQKNEPTGTNLFDATQTEAMIRYLVEGMPAEAMTTNPSDAQDSPRPSLGKDSPAKRDSDTHAVVPKSDDGQNALHAALREACKSAAKKLFPDGFDTEFRMLAARAVAEKIIEQELTPVVEALVGAAYKACANICDGYGQEGDPYAQGYVCETMDEIAARIRKITPESAARALREHDNALIERCIKIVEETQVTHGDHYGTYQALSLDAPELIRAIRALSHPVEEEK